MGSVCTARSPLDVEVSLVGSHAIDRIELLDGDRRLTSHSPVDRRDPGARLKFLLEAGWGLCTSYGLEPADWDWNGTLDVQGGRLVGLERCFSRGGQSATWGEAHCAFHLVTAGRTVRTPFGMTQGIIFEVEGTPQTLLKLTVEGRRIDVTLDDVLTGSRLVPFLDEAVRHVREASGLDEGDVNPDTLYHNARKVKLHRAVPEASYRLSHTFRSVQLEPGCHPLYVRVAQQNGQLAWSSPIWVSVPRD